MTKTANDGRWIMRSHIVLLVFMLFGSEALFAQGSPPQRLADKAMDSPGSKPNSRTSVIDAQILQKLTDRLERARGNRSELLRIDRELKVVIASAVRAGRTHSLTDDSRAETKSRTDRKKRRGLDGAKRQAIHLAAFELRSLYGKIDAHSVRLKRELVQRLSTL